MLRKKNTYKSTNQQKKSNYSKFSHQKNELGGPPGSKIRLRNSTRKDEIQNQARSRPSLVTRDVIINIAQMRVKLALNGDAGQTFVREDQINDWHSYDNVTHA